MNATRHPVEVLEDRMETMRLRLIEHFGGADSVPESITTAYLAAALCTAELAGANQAQVIVVPSVRVPA